MSDSLVSRVSNVDITPPRIAALTGPRLESLLWEWLRMPNLSNLTIVSFVFENLLPLSANAIPRGIDTYATLFSVLGGISRISPVTFVTSPPKRRDGVSPDVNRRRDLERLSNDGVRVLLHPQLHAKIYLFATADRQCWCVGSSNLTAGGLRSNTEVNIRGYHPADYLNVENAAKEIALNAVAL